MVTGAEVVWGFRAIGQLLSLAKEAKDLTDSVALQARLATIYPLVLEAQMEAINASNAHAADVARVRELEEEIRGFKNWEAEKQRYELKSFGWGAYAYALKEGERGTTPPHYICTNCYKNGEASILHYGPRAKHGTGFASICPSCKAEFDFGGMDPNQWA